MRQRGRGTSARPRGDPANTVNNVNKVHYRVPRALEAPLGTLVAPLGTPCRYALRGAVLYNGALGSENSVTWISYTERP